MTKNGKALADKVAESQKLDLFQLLNVQVDVKIMLEGFPYANDILACLTVNGVFGLGNDKGHLVVFDCKDYIVYDYSFRKLNILHAPHYTAFLNVIKLTLINNRMFIKDNLCVEYFRSKKLMP